MLETFGSDEQNYKSVLYELTTFYEEIEEYQNALLVYNKMLENNFSEEGYIYYYRAFLYKNYLNDSNNAIKDYEKSLNILPERIETYTDLGDIYIKNGNYQKAEENFKKAIELNNEERNSYYPLINLYIVTKNFDEATKITNKTIEMDPNDCDGYYRLYLINYEKGNYLKSFLELSNSINKKKEYPDYYVYDYDQDIQLELEDMYIKRGELSLKLNDTIMACENYNFALDLVSENDDLKNNIQLLIDSNCK